MTPSEFKAWFDGFTEAFDVDRYLPSLPVYPSYPYWRQYPNGVGISTYTTNAVGQSANQLGSGGPALNSLSAMTDLGRAEAQSLAA